MGFDNYRNRKTVPLLFGQRAAGGGGGHDLAEILMVSVKESGWFAGLKVVEMLSQKRHRGAHPQCYGSRHAPPRNRLGLGRSEILDTVLAPSRQQLVDIRRAGRLQSPRRGRRATLGDEAFQAGRHGER